MQVNFDYFNMPKDPQLFVCNANNKKLAPIVRYADSSGTNSLQLTMNYNRTSDLSIQIYKFIEDTFHHEALSTNGIAECYQYVANYRQIHVENLGYFIINQITEVDDGFDPYWDVKASSCELEINSKALVFPKGTYLFYDATNPLSTTTILGKILNLCPTWSVGNVSTIIAALYRTFDDTSENAYSFMMNTMATAFSCVCDFDIENRKINIIDMQTEIPSTDILLTYDNVLNNVQLNQPAENIITALNVTGGSDSVGGSFDITSVNPIGGNVIYNFQYFMNTVDMEQSLIDAINAWQTKVNNNQSTFSNLVLQIQNAQGLLETSNGQLSDLNTQWKDLNHDLSVCLADPNRENYSTIKSNIDAKQAAINSKQTDISNQNTTITNLQTQLSTLQSSLKIQNNFTTDQFIQLSKLIHQMDFKDENIVVTNSMTYAQKQTQAQALYDKAELLLGQRCIPTTTIEIDCQNFILMHEFNIFREQIELGKMIHVELNRGNIIDMMLLQYQINYDTKELKIQVSNRLKLHDIVKDVQDWQTQLATSANTLSLNKQKWSYPNGVITNIEDFVGSPINLTKNGIIAASNQKMLIDDTGYHGFEYSNGTYDPDQCWMTNYGLYFTTDAWDTVKCGFGKMKLPDGSIAYGFNGDVIVAGKIQSQNGKCYFDLNNNVAAVSKLIDAGDSGIYATIGTEEPQYGNAQGLFLYDYNDSDTKFAQIYRIENGISSSLHAGARFLSLGDISILSSSSIGTGDAANRFEMRKDTAGQGSVFIDRAATGSNIETVFYAYNGETDIYGRDIVKLHSDSGNMAYRIASDGFHFIAGGYEIGLIDSGGWKGWVQGVNPNSAFTGTKTVTNKDGSTTSFTFDHGFCMS